jgi:hypothetical protein
MPLRLGENPQVTLEDGTTIRPVRDHGKKERKEIFAMIWRTVARMRRLRQLPRGIRVQDHRGEHNRLEKLQESGRYGDWLRSPDQKQSG